jgi:hypothetical protein
MTLKLAIFFGAVCAIWLVIILTPIVRNRVTRDWRKCGICGLFWHIRTREMTFELLMAPKELEYQTCPECSLRAQDREKGRP